MEMTLFNNKINRAACWLLHHRSWQQRSSSLESWLQVFPKPVLPKYLRPQSALLRRGLIRP